MKKALILIFSFCTVILKAQNYSDEIKNFREKIRQEYESDEKSPITREEVKYLNYYEPDSNYRVSADFIKIVNAVPFDIPTSANKSKKYIRYGILKFKLNGRMQSLHVYQGVELLNNPDLKDYLFVPFADSTNGNETYINGRYMDFKTGDIQEGKLIIDFNKAYNPYCAYSDSYNCPRIPEENNLRTSIRAGEKNFGLKRH
jgi:uncharacterized protein (DUF1684 family)